MMEPDVGHTKTPFKKVHRLEDQVSPGQTGAAAGRVDWLMVRTFAHIVGVNPPNPQNIHVPMKTYENQLRSRTFRVLPLGSI